MSDDIVERLSAQFDDSVSRDAKAEIIRLRGQLAEANERATKYALYVVASKDAHFSILDEEKKRARDLRAKLDEANEDAERKRTIFLQNVAAANARAEDLRAKLDVAVKALERTRDVMDHTGYRTTEIKNEIKRIDADLAAIKGGE